MALPRPESIMRDFDPALSTDAVDVGLSELTLGDLTLLPDDPGSQLFLREDDRGVKFVDSAPSAFTQANYTGVPQSTFISLLRFPEELLPSSEEHVASFGLHMASSNVSVTGSPTGLAAHRSGSSPTAEVPAGRWQVWAITFDEDALELAWYVDGAELGRFSFEWPPYLPAETPTVLLGQFYRAIGWDRVLTPAEIAQAGAYLRDTYLAYDVTVTWAPPLASGGLPVTGYLVRHYDGSTVSEEKLPAEARELTLRTTGGHVQVAALNDAGASTPVEIEV